MERIPINMMTIHMVIKIRFLGRKVTLGSGTIVWPGTNCNVNRCVTMASTNTPSIFANASMDKCFYRHGVWEATEIRVLVGREAYLHIYSRNRSSRFFQALQSEWLVSYLKLRLRIRKARGH